jgi:hypothetical protein
MEIKFHAPNGSELSYFPLKIYGIHYIISWMGRRAGQSAIQRLKIPLPIVNRTPDRPIASHVTELSKGQI